MLYGFCTIGLLRYFVHLLLACLWLSLVLLELPLHHIVKLVAGTFYNHNSLGSTVDPFTFQVDRILVEAAGMDCIPLDEANLGYSKAFMAIQHRMLALQLVKN